MKIEYTTRKKGKEIIIKETGHFKEYTLTELNDIIAYNEKMKGEAEANLKLRTTELFNVIEHYPKVLELTDEEVFRVAFYGKVKKDVADYENKIKEFDEVLSRQHKTRKIADGK